ncbi:MAG: hypothetical protein IJ391_05200 [Clostridia bacterium]|nr:hypothetical protein [Clostridia bacterium]
MANILGKDKYIMFRGKPLVREGGQFLYGSLDETHTLFLGVHNTEKVGEYDLPGDITVMVRANSDGKIVKATKKHGLYEALDVGAAWLELALKGKLA